jgi:hypothetical protein
MKKQHTDFRRTLCTTAAHACPDSSDISVTLMRRKMIDLKSQNSQNQISALPATPATIGKAMRNAQIFRYGALPAAYR